MFALSDARDYSFLKVPYLEQGKKITDQSNFLNNVTLFTSRSRARLKNGRQTGEKLPKAEKAFKDWNHESYRNTEQDIIGLPPWLND